MKNFDSYYDPPEEPEAEICEDCGQELEVAHILPIHSKHYGAKDTYCPNQFCPSRFHGDAKALAEKLVDTLDTVSRLENKIKSLKRILDIVSPGWDSDFRFGSSNK